jgi:hypothetical protein
MKSFRSILSNIKLPLTLFINELVFFMLIFLGFVSFFIFNAGRGMFSHKFSVLYFLSFKGDNPLLFIYIFVLLVIFGVTHFIFIIGVFNNLPSKRKTTFTDIVSDGLQSFFKFLLILIVYILIALLFFGILTFLFSKLKEQTFNTKLPLVYFGVKFLILFVLMSVLSYFQTKTRLRFVTEGKTEFLQKFTVSNFFSFFFYQVLSILCLAVGSILVYKLLCLNGIIAGVVGLIILQILLFLYMVFKLASYKTVSTFEFEV